MTAFTISSNVSLRGENLWEIGEKVCLNGERILLVILLVVVLNDRALGRRFCFEGAESLDGLQELRIVSIAISRDLS